MLGFETRELNVEVAVQSFVICREQFDTKRWLGSKLQTLYRKSDALNLSKLSWWSTRKYWSNLWRRALECEKGLIKYLSSSRCFSREEAILSCSPILWMLWLCCDHWNCFPFEMLKLEKQIAIIKRGEPFEVLKFQIGAPNFLFVPWKHFLESGCSFFFPVILIYLEHYPV